LEAWVLPIPVSVGERLCVGWGGIFIKAADRDGVVFSNRVCLFYATVFASFQLNKEVGLNTLPLLTDVVCVYIIESQSYNNVLTQNTTNFSWAGSVFQNE